MRFNLKLTVLALISAGVLLQGCSSQTIRDAKEKSAAIKQDAELQAERIQTAPIKQANPTRSVDAYIPVILLADKNVVALPDMFQNTMSIHREFNSLNEVAERVTYHSGLLVTISPDALAPAQAAGAAQASPASAAPTATPTPGSAQANAAIPVRLEYTGNVSGFLDIASSRYGVSWRYVENRIEIYRTLTKTFVIKALPGAKTMSADISNNDGPKVTSAISLSIWEGLDKTLTSMKSSFGKVYVNQSTGTVTVTDIPSTLSQMETYIDQQNSIMGKQVLLSIKVLSVSARNADNRGVNLNAVFNSLSQNFGWSFASAFTTDINAASLTMRVLDTAGSTTGGNIKSYQGTNAIITALRTEGEVSVVTSWSGVTMNNQPAPIVVGRDSGYLSSVATTITTGVGTTTTLTPGTYVTGISMSMLPHILDGGELLLESSMSISTLANMFSQTANGNTVQFPEIDKRKLQNSISMRSGQTLILTGFDQNAVDTGEEDTGVGMLGGGVKRAKNNKDILVILITAVTADKL